MQRITVNCNSRCTPLRQFQKSLQPPPVHLPHLNPRQHILPEHPQIHAHPVERPFRQRRPVRRAAADGAVVGGEPGFIQVCADMGRECAWNYGDRVTAELR